MSSAPFAMPHHSAMYPAPRPITSMMLQRSCEVDVSRTLSMASIAVLTAVSNPMVYSVHAMSRSIVPGRPIVLMPRDASFCAPLKEPSPPITMMPSMPCFLQISAPFFCPSSVVNSMHRAVCRIVPPLWMMSETDFLSMSMISSCSRPA